MIAGLLLFGMVMVYSASVPLAESPRYHVTPVYFLIRHVLSIGAALLVALAAYRIPASHWQRLAPLCFLASAALLVIVLIPGVGKGRSVRGAGWDTAGCTCSLPSS